MRFYWSIGSMPELSHLSPDQRRRLLKQIGAWRVMINIILRSLVIAGIASMIIAFAIQWTSDRARIIAATATAAMVFPVVTQWQFVFIRAQMRFHIMRSLRGQHVPVCLKCGYDQTGNTHDRCPECNAPIRVPRTM